MYANTQRFVFICLTPTLYGFSRIWKSVFSYSIAKVMIVFKYPNGLGRKKLSTVTKAFPPYHKKTANRGADGSLWRVRYSML